MKRISVILVLLLLGWGMVMGCVSNTQSNIPQPRLEPSSSISIPPVSSSLDGVKIRLETTMGTITLRLFTDMPITTGNFERLVREGYYNGTIFHRVIDKFMIQGGDPTGTGRGGPGYTINDEFTPHNQNLRGTIAMANAGPNTGGSQFFINLVDNRYLDGKHPVFGEVIDGMDVVDRIGKVATDTNNHPLQNVTILKATVV